MLGSECTKAGDSESLRVRHRDALEGLTFRPARPADIAYFFPELRASARSIVAEKDGELVGIGGVFYDVGGAVMYTHVTPKMTKRERVVGANKVMDIVRGVRGPVYAVAGIFETAPGALRHFGFERLSDRLYVRWPNG